MTRLACLMMVVAPLLAPLAGAAQETPAAPSRFTLGARLSAALPTGHVSTGSTLGGEVKLGVPLTVEAGYGFAPALTLGAYFQYGLVSLATAAPLGSSGCVATGASCDGGRDLAAGVQLLVRPRAGAHVEPWLGIGAGLEWLRYDIADAGGSGSIEYRGVEFLRAQGGVEWSLSRHAALGPFAQLRLGQFDHASIAYGGDSRSGEIASKEIHGWLELGIRGRFDL
jgi:hypothetical protein